MDNVRMLDRRHDLDLAPDPYQISFGFDFGLFYGFYGDFLSSLLVDSELDLSVRPLSELFYYVEPKEFRNLTKGSDTLKCCLPLF